MTHRVGGREDRRGRPHHLREGRSVSVIGRTARPTAAPVRRRRQRSRNTLVLWGFLAPALLLFAYFKFYPIGYGVWLSFHDVAIMGGTRFVGLDNFRQAVEDT